MRPQPYQAPEVVASGSPTPAQVACLHFLVIDCSHACLPACLPAVCYACTLQDLSIAKLAADIFSGDLICDR